MIPPLIMTDKRLRLLLLCELATGKVRPKYLADFMNSSCLTTSQLLLVEILDEVDKFVLEVTAAADGSLSPLS